MNPRFFSKDSPISSSKINHVDYIIPLPVSYEFEHKTRNDNGEELTLSGKRSAVFVRKYFLQGEVETKPLIFFHGGPDIINEGQFNHFIEFMITKGHTIYVCEIAGSSLYSKMASYPLDCTEEIKQKIDQELKDLARLNEKAKKMFTGLNEFEQNYIVDVSTIIDYVHDQQISAQPINIVCHSIGFHHVLRSLQKKPELHKKVDSLVDIAGTYDFALNRWWHRWVQNSYNSSIIVVLTDFSEDCLSYLQSPPSSKETGHAFTTTSNPVVTPDNYLPFSVCKFSLENAPRTLIIHGGEDSNVDPMQSRRLERDLKKANKEVAALFYPHSRHEIIKNLDESKNEEQAQEQTHCFEQMSLFLSNPSYFLTHNINQSDADFEMDETEKSYINFLACPRNFLGQRSMPKEDEEKWLNQARNKKTQDFFNRKEAAPLSHIENPPPSSPSNK